MDKPIVVLGIDPSINSCGLALVEIVDIKEAKFRLVDKTSLINKVAYPNRWEKKEGTLDLFAFYLESKIPMIAFSVIENYSYGSVGYLSDAGELVGLLKHHLWSNKINHDVIAPSTVKRIVGGSGLAKKDQVAAQLHKFLVNYNDFEFNNFDETDAIAVAIAYIIDTHTKNDITSKPGKNKKSDRKDRPVSKRKRADK